jgi:hypothetical protein
MRNPAFSVSLWQKEVIKGRCQGILYMQPLRASTN